MKRSKYISAYKVKLVREKNFGLPLTQFRTPDDVARFAWQFIFEEEPREIFVVCLLDAGNKPIGINTVSTGSLTSAIVDVRSVFQHAILSNAAAIILLHNHPSGNPEPSREDIRITRTLSESGKILGIPVHDHLVLCGAGKYTSLAERGLIDH